MNKKLIFQLSLFGLAMAFATVFWISSKIEPYFWFAIFIFCAVTIAKKVHTKFFLHGFLVSMLNYVWITIVHLIYYDQYIVNHAAEIEMMEKFPMPYSLRIGMLLTKPALGAMYGVILGMFCIIASYLIKRKRNSA